MSETPKKPRAKKAAAPEPQAPRPEAAAQAKKPDDAALKEAVLLAALPHAAFDGFTDSVLAKAGVEAGATKADLARLFESGPVSLIEYYSAWADARMQARLAQMDIAGLNIRARITAAVLARLGALEDHKEAARRAAALLALPMNVALGARLTYRTVDAMWRAAGDTATDFNFYTKRGILAGVYGSTAMRWFNDPSEDGAATREFLAARIENVMQIEKFKAKAKEALSSFSLFAGKPGA